ncbi:hypothetical protein BU24DRAFT_426489 [Aaosphaeria arxii CBS 175.79]|uniref:Uncharacterized protein n=1 Tax=Aaosphaeria arxii CBS 175.79 TaxID=1450172 RepID=A0A6A5XEX9_9PLEO|nr:uncharacterized protein BU24DRAFT_426489 [Aaosphaeria arxii CBS 175.79]KAF2011406.1 hypothetical protein BU24DRAFT_426489 [Aaosphaeria arxii CBS 175.79]
MFWLFLADVLSAAIASLVVSPLVYYIDGTVVTKASTGGSLLSSFQTFIKESAASPLRLLKSHAFFLLWLVYLGTYSTANCIDTVYAKTHSLPPTSVTGTPLKFIATTIVSTAICVYKDGYFARLYGSSVRSDPVPAISYALFVTRDAVTVFACFIFPSVAAPYATRLSIGAGAPFQYLFGSETASLRTMQLLSPAGVQFISTPFHLMGLEMHNRRSRVGLRRRFAVLRRDMPAAVALRMLRIVPALGLGNVLNVALRANLIGGTQ